MKLDYYLARLWIAANQIVVGTIMMRSTRQSKRPRPTDSNEEAFFSEQNKAKELSTRVSSRNLNNCIELAFPKVFAVAHAKNILKLTLANKRTAKSTHIISSNVGKLIKTMHNV